MSVCYPAISLFITLKLKGIYVLCSQHRDVCPAILTIVWCLLSFQLDRLFRMNIGVMTSSVLFLCSVFEVHIMLFGGKLITIAFERIRQNPAGKICIRAITFPIKE